MPNLQYLEKKRQRNESFRMGKNFQKYRIQIDLLAYYKRRRAFFSEKPLGAMQTGK
jgi:hypothetical protein